MHILGPSQKLMSLLNQSLFMDFKNIFFEVISELPTSLTIFKPMNVLSLTQEYLGSRFYVQFVIIYTISRQIKIKYS